MRKTINYIFIAALFSLGLLIQGCAANRMAGFTGSGLVYREWYGDMGMSYAVNPSFARSFIDSVSGPTSPFYYESHQGQYGVPVDISAAFLMSVYSGEDTRVSCGLKFTDNCSYQYSYNNSFANTYGGKEYTYSNSSVINFWSKNTFSFIFPDVEYRLPFAKFLTVDCALELMAFSMYYKGGNNTHNYNSSTPGGVTADTNTFLMPQSIANATLAAPSNIFGNITFGLLYNF
jgi:hypothetical protein